MTTTKLITVKALLILIGISINSYANEIARVPAVSKKADESFRYDYTYATDHKAYAIASDGTWRWVANKADQEEAKSAALSGCQSYTKQKCQLYAVNNQLVFDIEQWRKSWGPYQTSQQAKASAIGIKPGERFPDLQFTSAKGKKTSIHKIRNKVIFVHFWGSWCPPCAREFTELIDLYRVINDLMPNQVEFIMLQLKEPITESRAWANDNQLTSLPLSDSGALSAEDNLLTLANNKKIKDRVLAKVFPASYVLDKNGVVVFSSMGSKDNWTQYIPFFMHVSKHSDAKP